MRFVNYALTILVTLGVSALPIFAQDVAPIPTEGVPFTDLGVLLGNVLALLFFIAGLLAFLFIMIGGIQWIAAGGDKIAAAAARDRCRRTNRSWAARSGSRAAPAAANCPGPRLRRPRPRRPGTGWAGAARW